MFLVVKNRCSLQYRVQMIWLEQATYVHGRVSRGCGCVYRREVHTFLVRTLGPSTGRDIFKCQLYNILLVEPICLSIHYIFKPDLVVSVMTQFDKNMS